jgi:hypothetical protein
LLFSALTLSTGLADQYHAAAQDAARRRCNPF